MISRMSKKITLKLRDLTKGETTFREFDDEEGAPSATSAIARA